MNATNKERVLGLGLIVLTLSAYSSVIGNGFVHFDDPAYVSANSHVLAGLSREGFFWALTTLDTANWHPLTWLSHMLDVQMYGINPAGHHLTNVILHSVNALLLFLLLREMTGALWRSFLVAALFALHPLHVESVAWVSERKDVLCAFFWMLTSLCYVRYVFKRSGAWYLGALFCFALGLLCKPMIVTLPFALLLLDYWPLARFGQRPMTGDVQGGPRVETDSAANLKRILYEKIPFLILAAASSVVTYMAQTKGGAMQSWEALAMPDRILNALYSYCRYLFLTVWPWNLAPFYPHPLKILNIWAGLASAVGLGSMCVVCVLLLRRKPYLAVGWFWFLGTLVPVIGIVQVGGQGMADRYTYIPLIGLFLAFVWGASEWFTRRNISRSITFLLAASILAVLVSASRVQVGYWRDTRTLFEHALAVTKENFMAHHVLSVFEKLRGNMKAHDDHYRQAKALNPRFVALMHNRIGVTLVREGMPDAAIAEFSSALAIVPDYGVARNNLAVTLARQGRFDDAIPQLRRVLKDDPHNTKARDSLYNICSQKAAGLKTSMTGGK
jgi:tetratricopeptide (TPR) repeat protein